MAETFSIILIKPSRYDDDGYVVQWRRAVYASNTLTVLNALAEDCASRRVLGEQVDIIVEAYDDQCGMPPVDELIKRMQGATAGALAGIVGAHTSQFPRGADFAKRFRDAGIPVVIGGFHVSGAIAMLPELAPELQAMLDLGVTLFAGEAEGRFEKVVHDARAGTLPPVYNYLNDPIDMAQAPPPVHLPGTVERHLALSLDPIDLIEASRGCPFNCSFCTVVNVHGRQSRPRSGESIVDLVRNKVKRGRKRFFFTDDNLARNRNWRAILEGLAQLREEEGLQFTIALSVDTQSDRVPDFIPLAVRAGAVQVFVGMESINPDTLALVGKTHNVVERYQNFFLQWKKHGVVTMVGYIIGFPGDTPESVTRDLTTIQEGLAIDLVYPFILTPLPGSVDHANLWRQGVQLEPDLSRYTSCHATMPHPHMSGAELEAVYAQVYKRFYSDEHTARILRRHLSLGGDPEPLTPFLLAARATFPIEGLHPFEMGLFRVKRRRERQPGRSHEAMVPFYLRRGTEIVWAQLRWCWQLLRLKWIEHAAGRRLGQPPSPADAALAGYDGGTIEGNTK